jgi:hypothetical protein
VLTRLPAFAAGSATVSWKACADPCVVGYHIYYGSACNAYTNEISVGKSTNVTVSGLVEGKTYYFAATAYSASGKESPFSSEVSYRVPLIIPVMSCSNTYAAVVGTNSVRYKTNTLLSGKKIVITLASTYTNFVFTGFRIYYPTSGVWTLQSSSNLLVWSDYASGTNSLLVPYTGGNRYFRFKAP